MLCLAGLQKRQFRDRMFIKKLQPSALFWTMQFFMQYVYKVIARPYSLFEPEEFVRLLHRQANQNPVAGWIQFEVIVVIEHTSGRSGRPET